MKTVLILVDALKSLYLTEENMPFLFSLAQDSFYVKQLIPCAGFCERSELFSGLDGFETGNFTAIGYLPEESPYKQDGVFLNFVDFIDKINKRVARKLFGIWKRNKIRTLSPYRIPYKSLIKFALTEDGNKQLVPHKDIFDVLSSSGMSYTLDGFTSLSDSRKRSKLPPDATAISEMKKGTDFIPIYIGITDIVGHRYGQDIEKIKPYLLDVDTQLNKIYDIAKQLQYAFCVLGDHGMVPISNKVDLMNEIKKTGFQLHKDYETFYDSTLARFWFFNESVKEAVVNCLNSNYSDYGFIVDKSNYEQYRIPLHINSSDGRPVYGDIVWCAKPGVLISPDYFHPIEASENGMHGYLEIVDGHGTGLFVVNYPGIEPSRLDKAESKSICGELCKILGIKNPN